MLNFTDFLWSYKISVSVQIYRDCNLQRKCGHLTEILPTFLKSVNGSSFPVAFPPLLQVGLNLVQFLPLLLEVLSCHNMCDPQDQFRKHQAEIDTLRCRLLGSEPLLAFHTVLNRLPLIPELLQMATLSVSPYRTWSGKYSLTTSPANRRLAPPLKPVDFHLDKLKYLGCLPVRQQESKEQINNKRLL